MSLTTSDSSPGGAPVMKAEAISAVLDILEGLNVDEGAAWGR